MVDTRSAGALGVPGALNFRSGDNSGVATKTSDDRASRGMDYYKTDDSENNNGFYESEYMDRSAQLRATLNSLALMNVAGIIKKR